MLLQGRKKGEISQPFPSSKIYFMIIIIVGISYRHISIDPYGSLYEKKKELIVLYPYKLIRWEEVKVKVGKRKM